MTYTLDQLASDCRTELRNHSNPADAGALCQYVKKALLDTEFVAEHLPADCPDERRVIYEDPELGFCVCAHVYQGPKMGGPHDHGPTWAIYGQADGTTEMTDWEIVTPASANNAAKVKRVKTYTLVPGDAHFYAIGAVHAAYRTESTRLIRIEGTDTDKVQRSPIEPLENDA